jgi:hypothetical protein
MSTHILPLTNQDDHHLYSLIHASTALQKSEETPHVMHTALQLPVDASGELAPAQAGACCAALALLALWLTVARYIVQGLLTAAGRSKQVESS